MTELCIDVIRGVSVSDVSPSDDRVVGNASGGPSAAWVGPSPSAGLAEAEAATAPPPCSRLAAWR